MKAKLFLALGASFAVFGVHGVVFPSTGRDISSPADWTNDSTMPNGGKYIDIASSGTYTATNDFSARLIRLQNLVNVTLDLTEKNPNATIVQQSGDSSVLPIAANNSSLTIKGGKWNMAGGAAAGVLRVGSSKHSGKDCQGRTVTFTDGAEVSGLTSTYLAGGWSSDVTRDSCNRLVISGGATVTTTNFYLLAGSTSNIVLTNNTLEIDGGVLNVLGSLSTDSSASSWDTSGNVVSVTGGGTLTIWNTNDVLHCGDKKGGMCMKISGAGSCATFYKIRAGYESSSSGNCIEVTDGGTLVSDDVYPGRNGSFNTLYVSNGTVRTGNICMGYTSTSKSNLVHFIGSETAVAFIGKASNGRDFFSSQPCGGSELRISDGACVRIDEGLRLFKKSFGEIVRVTRSAVFGHADAETTSNYCSLGYLEEASSNNVMFVEDGGHLDIGYLRVTCVSNSLIVSNGTITCHNSSGCTVGYKASDGCSRGALLELRGDSPRVQSESGPVMIINAGRIVFDMPVSGYAIGVVPVQCKNFEIDATSTLAASLDGYATRGKTATYTLVETTSGVRLGNGVLAAANAALGEAGAFSVSADGKKLLLRAKGQSGITVVVR